MHTKLSLAHARAGERKAQDARTLTELLFLQDVLGPALTEAFDKAMALKKGSRK